MSQSAPGLNEGKIISFPPNDREALFTDERGIQCLEISNPEMLNAYAELGLNLWRQYQRAMKLIPGSQKIFQTDERIISCEQTSPEKSSKKTLQNRIFFQWLTHKQKNDGSFVRTVQNKEFVILELLGEGHDGMTLRFRGAKLELKFFGETKMVVDDANLHPAKMYPYLLKMCESMKAHLDEIEIKPEEAPHSLLIRSMMEIRRAIAQTDQVNKMRERGQI